jgi:palmitoyltransferase
LSLYNFRMWPRYEEKYHEDRLCCCEYRDLNGTSNHLLGLCCNCQAIDESFEHLITCRRIPAGLLNQVILVINDRIRIPCPGGARKVDFKKVAVFLIPPCSIALSTVNSFSAISSTLALSLLCNRVSLVFSSHQYSLLLFVSMLLSFICLAVYLQVNQYIQPRPVILFIVVLIVILGLTSLFYGESYFSVPPSVRCLW